MRTTTLVALCVCVALVGCEPLDGFGDEAADPCNTSLGPAPVDGLWRITGVGSRTACLDERFNTDEFELSSKPLTIKQDGDGNLSLQGQSTGFTFSSGRVIGTCVSFETTELLADPINNLLFTWAGDVRNDGAITGTFSGEGPAGCQATGSFTITVQ